MFYIVDCYIQDLGDIIPKVTIKALYSLKNTIFMNHSYVMEQIGYEVLYQSLFLLLEPFLAQLNLS